jgi:hypothetical protein
MTKRFFAALGAPGVVTSAAVMVQSRPPHVPAPVTAAAYRPPKTPWGDPDLQGIWPGTEMVGVPLQRPAQFGTRNLLTAGPK